ncbi:hypothetical protein [Tropicibacter oceani]|uniref:Sulfotransferase family protein n=1 Tax=Tropicibacter oceani TaxID=3058420 RepID=A0ABY8QK42_9RHOB|nr:hypothetical protein [Tropicibacter oceani]WGW04994.1 hypothetical protein QF118_05445 [Tropicibacter oceani]
MVPTATGMGTMAGPGKLIIHAGFHKTGTTSVQMALHGNREALADHVDILLRDDILPLTQAARHFSKRRTPESLAEVARQADACFAAIAGGTRPVVIATEDLSGMMPGRAGLDSYSAAPILMQTLERAALARLGAATPMVFYFSTRAADPWVESLWWQHLRSTRIETDLDDYRREAQAAADLDAIIAAVRGALGHASVVSHALEDIRQAPEGPVSVLYDLLDLPQALRGPAPKPANTRPPCGLEPIFLALNRSGLPDDCVSDTKRRLLRAARRNAD